MAVAVILLAASARNPPPSVSSKPFSACCTLVDGGTVVVSSDQVKAPVAVRYAFAMNPEGCNLYNKEGLPASPFRTDQ